jgi:hypothetical protein
MGLPTGARRVAEAEAIEGGGTGFSRGFRAAEE